MKAIALTSLAFSLFVASAALGQEPPNLIPNGGFEEDADGDGMADHWRFFGDEGVSVTWGRDEGVDSEYSQRLTCDAFDSRSPASHVMLAQVDTFPLREGQWYRLSLQVKGQEIPGAAAHVALSHTGTWTNLGLNEDFRLGAEWREVSVPFRASQTASDHIRLQIWFASVGTLWVDDVRLVETEPRERVCTEALADLGGRNLVPNSSFECGTSGWGSVTTLPGWGGNLVRLLGEVDRTTASRHESSMRIEVDRATAPVYYFDYFEPAEAPVLKPLLANRGWIPVEQGARYTLSADVRSEPADVPIEMAVYRPGGGAQTEAARATGDWSRVSFTFEAWAPQVFIAIGPDLTESPLGRATLWVDGVQLERGDRATEYEPRAPVEVGIEWPEFGHLFASPDDARATITAFNATDEPRSIRVRTALTGFSAGERGAGEVAMTITGRGAVSAEVRPIVGQPGFYRLALSSDDAAVIPVQPERFAVFEPLDDADGPFGMNHAYPWRELNELSRDFGLTWFRDWSLKWVHVEPEKGRFAFDAADHQIDRVLDLGLNVIGLLPFPSSEWSTTNPVNPDDKREGVVQVRLAAAPRDLGEFADYVRATVKHYEGRITVWEILNEPYYTDYALPREQGYQVEDYVRLLEVAYKAVKEVAPEATVIGGIAGHPDANTRRFIELGGLEWVDALNLHAYPGYVAPESYIEPLGRLLERMREAGQERPIWFTEGAYYADDDLATDPFESWLSPLDSEAECAAFQARFNAILLAHGVKRIVYHSGTPGSINRDEPSSVFFEWDGAPRKMVVAQAAQSRLFGADTEPLGSVSDRARAYAFHSRGRSVVVLWDETASGDSLAAPAGTSLLDIQGNPAENARATLDGTPVYLVTDGVRTAEDLRTVVAQGLEE